MNNTMKNNSGLILFLVILMWGCASAGDKNIEKAEATGIYHYNITIAPDLSNRVDMKIHPKPIEDSIIISSTLDLVQDILHAGHRDTDQKDSYTVSFINQGLIRMYDVNQDNLHIDFAGFKNQSARMDFIKGRNKYDGCGLKEVVGDFKIECDRMYSQAVQKPHGADLWSFLQHGIDETNVKKVESPFVYADQKFQNRYKNILILLTDGYIESGLSADAARGLSKNQSYDLGESRIKQFRNAYKASGMTDMKAFFKKYNYGIIPLTNKHIENLNILVLEMYDRSLTSSGNASVYPTDADVMELFWTDWLTNSKVNSFDLKRCFPDRRRAKRTIENFMLKQSR